MRAVTDTGPTQPNQPKSEPVQNLFTLLSVLSSPDTLAYSEEQYNKCTIRYGDLKKQLAEDIIQFNAPMREKMLQLEKDEIYLRKVVTTGAKKHAKALKNGTGGQGNHWV